MSNKHARLCKSAAFLSTSFPVFVKWCLLNRFPLDNLAVSAQGFRRGANRVRKVRLYRASLSSAYPDTSLLEHVVSGVVLADSRIILKDLLLLSSFALIGGRT